MMELTDRIAYQDILRQYIVSRRWMIAGVCVGSVSIIGILLTYLLVDSKTIEAAAYYMVFGMLCAFGCFVAVSQYKDGMRPTAAAAKQAQVWLIDVNKYHRRQRVQVVFYGLITLLFSAAIGGLIWRLAVTFETWDANDDSSNIMAAAYCMVWGCTVFLCGWLVYRSVRRIRQTIQHLRNL